MSGRWLGGFCGLASVAAVAATLLYALLVLHPLAEDNRLVRVGVADLKASSRQLIELEQRIAALQRDLQREAPSYRDMLQGLRLWKAEAHSHVSRIAADVGLEATAMEWSASEPVTPVFESDLRRQWWRTGISVRLSGAWQAHRDFARELSHCECLVQVVEEKVTMAKRAGSIEASLSLIVYHPGEDVRV